MSTTYLGRPCPNGHRHKGTEFTLRYTCSNRCVECAKLNNKQRMQDPEKRAEANKRARDHFQKIKADPSLYEEYKLKKSIEFKNKYHSDAEFRLTRLIKQTRIRKGRLAAGIKEKYMSVQKGGVHG